MADLKVKFFGPPRQFSLTFTSSDSIMLQHCPIDVTGLGDRISPVANGGEGTAYDSQNPRHASGNYDLFFQFRTKDLYTYRLCLL